MIRRHLFAPVVAASALAILASAAAAAPTSWDQPSGSQAGFTYSDGQSENGLFGSPVVNDNGFIFAPPGLVASAQGGISFLNGEVGGAAALDAPGIGHDEASDTVSVVLNAKPNTVFTSIGARLRGDYSAFGLAGVDSNATLRVFNLDAPGASPIVSPLVFDPAFPQVAIFGNNAGEFAASSAPVIPASWRNIRVELSDFVSADAAFGSALIQTKGANIDVETASVPVPAAVAVAPILGVIAWKARRRFAR